MLESTVPKAESQKGYHNSINTNSFDFTTNSNNSGSSSNNGRKIQGAGYSNNSTGYLNTNAQYMDIIGYADRIYLFEKYDNISSSASPHYKDILVQERTVDGSVECYDSADEENEIPVANAKQQVNDSKRSNNINTKVSNAVGTVVDPKYRRMSIEWSITYLLDATGGLHIKAHVDCNALIVPIPRIGIQLQLNKKIFDTVLWQGQGPHECYTDRKGSTVHATHAAPALSLSVPYIVPCENGNRTDVSWIELIGHSNTNLPIENSRTLEKNLNLNHSQNTGYTTNGNCRPRGGLNGHTSITVSPNSSTIHVNSLDTTSNNNVTSSSGVSSNSKCHSGNALSSSFNQPQSIRIDCSQRFNFSLQEYYTEDLLAAKHSTTLEAFPRSFLSLNIDPYMMGVGGNDSWTKSVHEDHLLYPDETYLFDLALSFK